MTLDVESPVSISSSNTQPHSVSNGYRPQLISRHSSCLPSNHKNDTKKKGLSRRSRSASPCIKKTNTTYSGSYAGQSYKAVNEFFQNSSSPQLPVIRKQPPHASSKAMKFPRSNHTGAKQRTQVLSDHRKSLRISSVLENINTTKSETFLPVDVNSNYGCVVSGQDRYANTLYAKHRPSLFFQKQPLLETDVLNQNKHSEGGSSFDSLPLECKEMIFSYLTPMERGRCMFVCNSWYRIARTPQLWTSVNLNTFMLCYGHDLPQQQFDGDLEMMLTKTPCTMECYHRYIRRIDQHVNFLIDVKPRVKRLELSFDVVKDNWITTIRNIFRYINMDGLEYADINWRDTPTKPPQLYEQCTPSEWIRSNQYLTRRRRRDFLTFLEDFAREMPNLKSLVIPFCWCDRMVKCLTSMKRLQNLVLKKYTCIQQPSQAMLDKVTNIKSLEKLLIEFSLSSNPVELFSISSPTLKYLDISQCRGFYVGRVNLPSLQLLRIPISNPPPVGLDLPCIMHILREGAPALQQINNITLAADDVAAPMLM